MDVHEFAEMDPAERAAWKRQRRIDKARTAAALSGARYVPNRDDARADAETISAACQEFRERYMAQIESEHGAEYLSQVLAILATFPAEG